MNQITVYTTSTCPYCDMVKNYLSAQGVAYTEVNVAKDQEAARKLVATTGQMGVPQTNINGEWVLGFDPERIKSHLK
ncbi:glutaredoxin family protein [Mesobacillus zeae]|uniref:Glutaredoxin family protein n=1 Tax=Mesobacillus zeae TaxID=1917180 RepID=A0A398BCZ8_9BACI|nr:glutaredoxin family protein [Mesobacillus zeae]RID88089.1 glutaredoxin family protein [Mesobacillus zeae]